MRKRLFGKRAAPRSGQGIFSPPKAFWNGNSAERWENGLFSSPLENLTFHTCFFFGSTEKARLRNGMPTLRGRFSQSFHTRNGSFFLSERCNHRWQHSERNSRLMAARGELSFFNCEHRKVNMVRWKGLRLNGLSNNFLRTSNTARTALSKILLTSK